VAIKVGKFTDSQLLIMFNDPVVATKLTVDSTIIYSKDIADGGPGHTIGVRLVSRPDGSPDIVLSLILQRQPTSQDSIRPLIKSGVLTLQLKLDSSDFVVGFFARQVAYSLYWQGGISNTLLAGGESQGSDARTVLSVSLDKQQTLDALSLMEYRTSSFLIKAKIRYRSEGQRKPVRLTGIWQDIATFIREHCADGNTISKMDLTALIDPMLKLNLLAAVDEQKQPTTMPSTLLTRIFFRQSGIILTEGIDEVSKLPVYILRNERYAIGVLDYAETMTVSTEKSMDVEVNIAELLKKSPTQIAPDQSIFLVAQQDDDSSRTVPVKLNVTSKAVGRDMVAVPKVNKLAVINGKLSSLSLAIQPVSNHIVLAKPEVNVLDKAQLLNLVSFDLFSKKRAKSLPVVIDVNAPYFDDRLSQTKAWYAPKFVLLMPDLNADPNNASFNFTYETKGATNAGKPALTGKVRFVLQVVQSEDSVAAIAASGRTDVLQVPLQGLTVSMLLPFVDESDGNTKQYSFPANITLDGDKVMTEVELSNDWLRLAYGSLSTPGFQSNSIQVQIRYVFSCYNPVTSGAFEVIFGAKSIKTDVLYSGKSGTSDKRMAISENFETDGHFDAAKLQYSHPLGNLQYNLELPKNADVRRGGIQLANISIGMKPLHAIVPARIKSIVYLQDNILAAFRKLKYNLNIQSVQQAVPLLFPCTEYGNFYQQVVDGGMHSLGCQDAFKLGEIVYKEYEELLDLRDEQFEVYRSLAQPGRFILVPVRYCISRREAEEADAYRPLIFLNALLDPDMPANNKVELRVTLQPDIPLFKIYQLRERLKAYHPSPMVENSLSVQNTGFTLNWAIDPGIATTTESALSDANGPFISTYFSTDLPGWQLLKAVLTSPGLSGTIAIQLADGSRFLSNLLIKLDVVRGPWQNGPIRLTAENGQMSMTNKTEGKINIIDLVRYEAEMISEIVPVEVTLEPEASCTVTATEGLVPVYTHAMGDPIAIEEIRSFVEDIYGNYIIVNLLNFANHNLLQIEVEAKLQGLNEVKRGTLTEVERVIDFDYVLPLTTFLEKFTLDFRITKIFNDQPAELTNWMEWDLNNGPLSITPDLLTN
jgi:hypothetical protein